MNIPKIRAAYVVQYRGALIGRQFKALMQVMPFALHGLVDMNLRTLWRTLGEVGALLWSPIITEVENYLVSHDETWTLTFIDSNMIDLVRSSNK